MNNSGLMCYKLKKRKNIIEVDKSGKNMLVYGVQCSDNVDIITMYVIKYIYVKGLSSILYDKLVAENEFCYDIAFKMNNIKSNYFIIEIIYREDCFDSIKIILEETFALDVFNKIEDEEYERAKNMIITEGQIKRERISAVLNDRVENSIFETSVTLTSEKLEELNRLSVGELKSMVYKALFC